MIATFAMAGGAFAASPSATRAAGGKVTATLKIIKPSVSIKRKGSDEFKPAKDGQKLRVGDSVQTDATGFAQVNYTDESLTRLDVNTTFTIVSLIDDAGNRKIKGKVDAGQTWNRTSALTESETFEQEGAGATAAVVGTAFNVQCDAAVPQHCTFTSVIDGIQLTTIDGDVILMNPLEQCDATEVITDVDADLCAQATKLTVEAAIANQWILLNLFLDGLAGFEGIIVVENGQVVLVSGGPTGGSTGTEGTTTTTTTTTSTEDPPATGPPIIDPDNPVLVQSCSFAYPGNVCEEAVPAFPAAGLFSDLGVNVYFSINSSAGPSGLVPWFVVFVDLPDNGFGTIYEDGGVDPVETEGDGYSPTDIFVFIPFGVSGPPTGTMTVRVQNAEAQSGETVIPITVEYDSCGYSSEAVSLVC